MIGLIRLLFVNSLFSLGVLGILQTGSDPIALLWSLTNFAIQSRQNYPHIFNNNYETQHQSNNFLPNTRLLLEALHSIAENDDHHCIPKLLCEMAAGKDVLVSNGRQLSLSPALQIDMDSLFGLLSSFETPSTSPILLLGKAALLGYKSKDGSEACTYAYPRCPSSPDVLLNYLNNYNGGFFRYFSGINSPYLNQNNVLSSSTSPNQISQNRPSHQQDYGYRYSKERYSKYPINEGNYMSNLKFPLNYNSNNIEEHHGQISFPQYDFDNEYKRPEFNGIYASENYRDGKKLSFPRDDESYTDEKSRLLVYSDRTGTGELLVDTLHL